MTVLILIACFLALPVGIWIGYRAGYDTAMRDVEDRQMAYIEEIRRLRDRSGSTLLRARPAAAPIH